MDLSKFKWPVIILVVAFAVFIVTDPGINWMYKGLTNDPIGQDPKKDESNEAGLSKLGGFLMKTFRYRKANMVLETAVNNYPQGKNYWHNQYRLVKCAEKIGDYQRAVDIMEMLMIQNAAAKDSRVPGHDNLRLRADKLIEMHELGEVGRRVVY